MPRFNLEKVQANVRQAETADLLDRATVWRDGMEPEALEVIDAELRRRGVKPEDLEAHRLQRAESVIVRRDGWPAVCYYCGKPAVARRWIWGRWRFGPPLPRRASVCEEHYPGGRALTEPAPSQRPPV
jgi:hypothetical protein